MKYTIEETERFWRKVEKEKSTVFYFGTRCWEWTAAITKVGYGELTIRQNVLLAHRVSYELAFGEIPRGLLICHNCDNRKCVNPHHLFLGTHKDNTHDMMKKGRHIYITKVGEENGNHILSNSQVVEIRNRAASSEKQNKLAKEYEVSTAQISNIVTGKQRN